MKRPLLQLQYNRIAALYHKLNRRLNRHFASGRFQRFSKAQQYKLVKRLEKLRRQLGRLEQGMKLAGVAAATCLVLKSTGTNAQSQPAPIGQEFQVNTYTTGQQMNASAAMDNAGNYVVTWQDYGKDGSSDGIYAQRYSAGGVAQGNEFQVNTYTTGSQGQPSIAMDDAGNFVITWESNQDGSGFGIYAQLYDASGTPQGNEFKVNSYTTSDQRYPSVAMDDDGDFVITWQSDGQDDGYARGIYAQRYDAAGTAQGGEFPVNSDTPSYQGHPTVACADNSGGFVIAWQSLIDGSLYGVYARRYNSAGVAQGNEFRVNTYTTGYQSYPSIVMHTDGDFVIIWQSDGQDGSDYGIYARYYDALGNPEGNEYQINQEISGDQINSSVTMVDEASGDFVITWQSKGQDGSDYGVYARRYDASGIPVENEFPVNSYTAGSQSDPFIAADESGNFVIAWESNVQDGDNLGIFAQRYTINNALPVLQGGNLAVSELSQGGAVVGIISANDPDGGQTLTYAITAGNTGNVFSLNSSTGEITLTGTLDYQTTPSYALTIEVTDNGSPSLTASATITITVISAEEESVIVPAGAEFQVNTYTTGYQNNPSVAMDSDGDFVIVWQDDVQEGNNYGIYARRYDAAGVPQGNEFLVNTYTTDNQRNPSIAMDDDGNFVIAWESYGQDGSITGIYARRYDASGTSPDATEFLVNTYTTDDQRSPSVAMDDDGNFIIVWESDDQDGSYEEIYAQRYDAAGNTLGTEFRVNNYTTGYQSKPSIAMDSDGDFVISWQDYGQEGYYYGIYARRYNATGTAQDINEFPVNTYTTENQGRTSVAMDNDGNFVIAWESYGQDGYYDGIYVRRYDASGASLDLQEFRVNTYTANDQSRPAIAMNNEGGFVVAWESDDQDGENLGIFAQRYEGNYTPLISGQTFSIMENSTNGTVVGTVAASDPNPLQTLVYSITAGNTGNAFAINSSTGEITVAGIVDYGTTPVYNLTVTVTDDGSPVLIAGETITINVTQVTGLTSGTKSSGLILYPNPAKGEVYLNIEGTVTVKVMDLSGQVLKEEETEDNLLSLESLSSGVYLVEISKGEEKVVRKLVVE